MPVPERDSLLRAADGTHENGIGGGAGGFHGGTQWDTQFLGKESWLLPHFSGYQLGMRRETY